MTPSPEVAPDAHVAFRPIAVDDEAALERLFFRLSPMTVYRRFFSAIARPDPTVLHRLADVDHHDREAIVAEVDGEIVAVARFDRSALRPDVADVAILVEDAWQGRGLGRRLMGRLTVRAREEGITSYEADVLAENVPVRGLIRRLAPTVRYEGMGAERHLVVPIAAA